MKKKPILAGVSMLALLTALTCLWACEKMNPVETESRLLGNRITVCHEGQLKLIRGNALLSHLEQGATLWSCQNNVIQAVVTELDTVDISDPIFAGFLSSQAFANYNGTQFGRLLMSEALMVGTIDGGQYITIPSETQGFFLFGYFVNDGGTYRYSSVVGEFGLGEQIQQYGEVMVGTLNGQFAFHEAYGDHIITVTLADNEIIDTDITPLIAGCTFQDCVTQTLEDCADSLPCLIACAAIEAAVGRGGVWLGSVAACCGIYVAFDCTGSDGC